MLRVSSFLRLHSTQTFRKTIQPKPIDKILIANRGEIACRIMRTARRLGIRTVAVYSDVDERSIHTEMADEAYNVGPAPSQQSYLRSDKIIKIAKKSDCQAIHPGYGFLSESVEFAELCDKEGIIFMGPPADAIRDMGIKSTSKAIMSAAGVPIINGYHGEDQSDEKLICEAGKIGFPLMIKAVRGGGGKGMRIAEKADDFLAALNSARIESQKSFGDSSVLLERFVSSPRHIEVQVFADNHGNAVYLFERDCSVQRRHQKIIEEAPAPGISDTLRRELGEAAVRAAKAVGYVGAGTVEFILDKNDHSFHFMEMNTRLQVEHPITEMITGTDLVEWQILVASGEPLPMTQDQIQCRGHAFEARIYAESPRDGFLPGAGPLNHLTTPVPSDYVRVETGVRQGDEVTVHYDPMIAKLVVWGRDRPRALNSLIAQLRKYHITGLDTNVNFLIDLARHTQFQKGNVHTGFIQEHFQGLFPSLQVSDNTLSAAAVALILNELNGSRENANIKIGQKLDPFVAAANLRINHDLVREFKLKFEEKVQQIFVKISGGSMQIKVGNGNWRNVKATCTSDGKRFNIQCNIEGALLNFSAVIDLEGISIFNDDGKTKLDFIQPKFLSTHLSTTGSSGSQVVSPMPGILEKLLINPGDTVKAGDPLAVIIAMKMEHILKSPRDAIIKSVGGKPGDNLSKGQVVVAFEDNREKDPESDSE